MSDEPTGPPNPRYASNPQVHYDTVVYMLLAVGDLIGVDDERRRKNIEARYLDRGPQAAVEFLYALATFGVSAYANGVAMVTGADDPHSPEVMEATAKSLMRMIDDYVTANTVQP